MTDKMEILTISKQSIKHYSTEPHSVKLRSSPWNSLPVACRHRQGRQVWNWVLKIGNEIYFVSGMSANYSAS